MRTSQLILAVGICVLSGGLVSNGWPQATMDTEAESKQVKSVIDQLFKALNSNDLKLLLAQLSDDAMIDSKVAQGKVSKPAYGEAMARAFQNRNFPFSDYSGLKIALVDATHAVAEGTLYVHSKNPTMSKYEWKLEKRDSRWLIVESNYK